MFAGEIAENAAFQRLDGLHQRTAQRARAKQLLSQQCRTGKKRRIRINENSSFYEYARLPFGNRSNALVVRSRFLSIINRTRSSDADVWPRMMAIGR